MKALIVDDVPLMRKIMNINLTKLGVTEIFEAADGEKAIRIFLSQPDIAIILTDLNMPNVDGLEFVRRIRASKKHDVKIIAITSEKGPIRLKKIRDMGVVDFIQKPFDFEKFYNITRPVIEALHVKEVQKANKEPDRYALMLDEIGKLLERSEPSKVKLVGETLTISFGEKSIEIDLHRAIEFTDIRVKTQA